MLADDRFKRLRDGLRRAMDPNRCPRCGKQVNPLLHILKPWLCSAHPPLGGWREPHKDEL